MLLNVFLHSLQLNVVVASAIVREDEEEVSSPYIYFESQQGVFLWKIVGRSLEGCWKIVETFDGGLYHDVRFNSPFLILNMIQRSDDSLDLLG